MPTCILCKRQKHERAFNLVKKQSWHVASLSQVCIDCERPPLITCTYCGKNVYSLAPAFKVSKRLWQCLRCQENTLAIVKKNILLRIISKLELSIRKTKHMRNNLIGNLRDTLFETIDGLKAGTITPDVAEQINDVAKTIIDSARAENEFIKLTGSAGSGFMPVSEGNLNNRKQLT